MFRFFTVATLFFPCATHTFLHKASEEVAFALYEARQIVTSRDVGRIAKIEKHIRSTYASLPKTRAGNLPPASVRFLMTKYFLREHGWHIDDLDNVTHDNNFTQDSAPALLARMMNEGLAGGTGSFKDIVLLILAVERMAVHDTTDRLRSAYSLNRDSPASEPYSVNQDLEISQTIQVLYSYLILFRNSEEPETNIDFHEYSKQRVHVPHWIMFVEDALLNFHYYRRKSAPFRRELFSFSDAIEVAQSLTEEYGKWQNGDCLDMRDALVARDAAGLGRVPLPAFYKDSGESGYEFTEATSYLREIGALEERSSDHIPQVRISNYILGSANCISRTSYYCVCCINECEVLMGELETDIQSPTAPAEVLVQLVSNMSSTTIEAPRPLSKELTEKMAMIASRHHNAIPLHGRLFQQWMHFAFPLECPYPVKLENGEYSAMKLQVSGIEATEEELRSWTEVHVLPVNESKELDNVMAMWIDTEELPLYIDEGQTQFSYWSGIVKVAVLVAVARFLYTHISGVQMHQKDDMKSSCFV